MDATLLRPRYRRWKSAGSIDEVAPSSVPATVIARAHSEKLRSLCRGRIKAEDDERVEKQIAAGLPVAHGTSRSSDRELLSFQDHFALRAPRIFGWRSGQGCGQPHLAQSDERLGCLERALIEDKPIVRLIDGTVVRVPLHKKVRLKGIY